MYVHPFDHTLRQMGWKRQAFDGLPAREDAKVPVSLLVITPPANDKSKYTAAIVDLRLWQKQRKVRIELVSPTIPDRLEPIIIRSIDGIRPAILGLAPCRCTGSVRRWEPHMLPLVPHKTMTAERLQPMVSRYIQLVRTSNWTCQTPSHLVP